MSLHQNLLVGCDTRDDAAVFDLGNGQALISTTDFFTPIVDNPFDFGRIAAANAISDVYAMGGRPLMAISVLGWPMSKLPAEIAAKVIEGAMVVCAEADIPLAGGHSIDISDPVFGLSVSGIVQKGNIKQNNTAVEGCTLYLNKPLGVGIMTTAAKKGNISEGDLTHAVNWMVRLNDPGIILGAMERVKAMTDVTGFGLLGHLIELCEGSMLAARLRYDSIPLLPNLQKYIDLKCIPGGMYRNWRSYGDKVLINNDNQRAILADPQTSGGLLIAVDNRDGGFDNYAAQQGFHEIGTLIKWDKGYRIQVD
jgi:selenide,water dikinase